MLSQCHGLDFHARARRQQDKHQLFEYGKVVLNGKGKCVKKKSVTLTPAHDSETDAHVGHLNHLAAVLNFEEECKDEEHEMHNFEEVEGDSSLSSYEAEPVCKCFQSLSQNLAKYLYRLLFLQVVVLVAFAHLLYFYLRFSGL
jgi:hypothetical protein